MADIIKIKRGTLAQIDAAAAASQLNAGEPYLVTDEGRIAVGLSASTYELFAKTSETGGGGGSAAAWVVFNGVTNAIADASNVSSITKHGVSAYELHFTAPLAHANYVIAGTVGNAAAGTLGGFLTLGTVSGGFSPARSTTSCRIQTLTSSAGGADFDTIAVAVFA